MERQTRFLRSEKGQSIVIIAAVMIGLLALTGLAIDGGNMFWQRRRAQNAADAGAMAGTRVLAGIIATCQSGGSENDSLIAQAVAEYVATNGYADSEGDTITAWYVNKDEELLGQVGAGAIPKSTTGVAVQIGTAVDTHFLKVVGISNSPLRGQATAMTGKVIQLPGGIIPIAVPDEAVDGLDPGDDWTIFENGRDKGGMFCDTRDDCIGDPASDDAHRGWLNLNYIYNLEYLTKDTEWYRTWEQEVPMRGCGPYPDQSIDDGIVGWCGRECPYPFPIFAGDARATNGDFIHGSPGARQSGLHEIVEEYNGSLVYAPVFDYVYTSDYMAENFPQPEGIGWPRAGGGGSAFLYHVVGFIGIRLKDKNPHDHRLDGEFEEIITGYGVISTDFGFDPDNCSPSTLWGMNLWR